MIIFSLANFLSFYILFCLDSLVSKPCNKYDITTQHADTKSQVNNLSYHIIKYLKNRRKSCPKERGSRFHHFINLRKF